MPPRSTRADQPSIADVAARAGVSPTTVSHALSGRRPVSARSAAAVAQAVSDLGYVPDHAARSLRRGRTQTLGLLVPDIANPYFAQLAKGVDDVARAHGYVMILCGTDFQTSRESTYLDVLRARGIDGLAYASGAAPPHRQLEAFARDRPLVAVDEEVDGFAASTVVSDNRRGGLLAGEHLRALGHRDVLMVNGPSALSSARRRRAGFFEAYVAEVAGLHEAAGDYRQDSGAAAVERALDGGQPFTAVFAANDAMAIGALRALRDRGLRVPADVSVAGFDDTALAMLVQPALTTVRQHVEELGRRAAARLVSALEGDGAPERTRTVLDVELVVRDSTARRRETA